MTEKYNPERVFLEALKSGYHTSPVQGEEMPDLPKPLSDNVISIWVETSPETSSLASPERHADILPFTRHRTDE